MSRMWSHFSVTVLHRPVMPSGKLVVRLFGVVTRLGHEIGGGWVQPL
jgi:hypothetical protein